MKRILILQLILFFTLPNLSAQVAYEPGFIVTVEDDTIRGFILNEIDAELSHLIKFKAEQSAIEKKIYSPEDIKSFGFENGRIFKRMMENDSTYIFAKNVLQGKIDLYIWRKKNRSFDLFLVNNTTNESVYIRSPKSDYKKIDQKNYLVEDQKFLGIINYLKGDTLINNETKKFKFLEKSIKKELTEFNNEFAEQYPVKEYSEKIDIRYNISVGSLVTFNMPANFRLAIYKSKNHPEKSKTFSLIRGITY